MVNAPSRCYLGTTLLLAAWIAAGPAAVSARSPLASRDVTTVKALIASSNAGSLGAVVARFDPVAVLVVGSIERRGRSAVQSWWRNEIAHHLRITLRSSIAVRGSTVSAVIDRSTASLECRSGCLERATWQFRGAQIIRMTLSALQRPVPPPPPSTVPPPPKGKPSPSVTPTIPT